MGKVFGSVRARAALGATVVVAVALVAAGLAVLGVLRSNLADRAEVDAGAAARAVASKVAGGVAYRELDLGDETPVQIVDEDHRVRAVSDDLQAVTGTGSSSVRPDAAAGEDHDDDGAGEVSSTPEYSAGTARIDGETAEYRWAALEVTDARGEDVTVYAGAPLATEQGAVGTVRDAMLIGLPLLLVVVAGVTWLVTRRALRPVEGIRREMAAITASTDLSRRVPVPGSYDEVARLARTTNETLTALEASVERQRAFVADASHELRSPVASLRTQLEVGAAHPELLDLDGAVEDVVRLQRLAADLLLLARLDAGERPAHAPVALDALVREELAQRLGDRVPVRMEEVAPVAVPGSRGQLARVLGNLVDNAQRHARGGVRVAVREEGRWAVLEVADDGQGVPEGERERIFERFVRLDDARSRDDGGAGLGLAIARDVAVRHGGTLAVRAAPEGGALFELRLPTGS
ncbi:sensor histidine kinase [Streptomyces antimycoticus]|uniref:sensor histidine kinase n=1 Tax=Streptomyces antimycoticus TaxID=68175 RepID=UPI00386531D0|nr:HAMP domain-containing histidine kinase [Streptomyces antimycoticus]